MEYSAVLIPEPEGGFTILIPAFPEYVGFATTEAEADELVHEGITFELERLTAAGLPTPREERPPVVMKIAA